MPDSVSSDSDDLTIQPECKSDLFNNKNISDVNTKIMAQQNPFAILKYAVEAISFFDG